jgi:hypothetical protein
MISRTGLIIIFSVVVVLYTVDAFAEFSKEYHKTFDVSKDTKLHLRHGDGNVSVTSWDKDQLQVDIYYRSAGDKEDEKLFRVDFDQQDQQIYITGKEFRNFWGFTGRYLKEYRYELKGPVYLLLDLKGDDGNVKIVNWRNDISVDLSDGDVDLENIRAGAVQIDMADGDLNIDGLDGELMVDCQDGDVILSDLNTTRSDISNQDGSVRITGASGSFKIRLADGSCHISGMKADELDLRTQDGNIRAELNGNESPQIRASCQDGNIDLILPSGTNAELQINGRRHSISTRLQNAKIERDEKDYLRAVLGNGAGSIELSAGDGRITVSQK